jgi:hypothetical protein
MMEQGAAPAGVVRSHALGRRRTPPGGSKTPCEELADGGANAPKARPGAVRRTPRWRAERRHVLATARALRKGRANRRAVPLIFAGGKKGTTAHPAPQTIGALALARMSAGRNALAARRSPPGEGGRRKQQGRRVG